MSRQKSEMNKAVEELIEEYKKGYNIELIVTASSLRYPPGLTESEKIDFATKLISVAANRIDKVEIARHADTVDSLINFALDNRLLNVAIDLARSFGAEPATIIRILQFMKRWAKGQDSSDVKSSFIPSAYQIVKNNEKPEEAVNFAIDWCLELGYTEYAVQLGDLREKPGLTENELEGLLLEHISSGDIIDSKTVCVLLGRELRPKEVRQIRQSAKFI
jgi:hypothetical protein